VPKITRDAPCARVHALDQVQESDTESERTGNGGVARARALLDGPCVTCHVRAGRRRPTRLFTVVCGPCWAAHGGKPAAGEIGPEPTETAPLRYPDSQRQWLAALRRADWVGEIRVDGQRNLLAIARHLMLAAGWETLESMPGWDTLMAKTGLGETTIQRWVQELKLRGWIVVLETGSTPLTRPMALALPDGTVLSRLDEGNRRAVYALRIPLSPDEALRWAADAIATEALWEGAHLAAGLGAGGQQETLEILPATGSEQAGPGVVGDKKGRPTWSFPCREKTQVGGYAREGAAVDNSGPKATSPRGINDTTDALRARSDEEQGPNWAIKVPTSGFEMLVSAGWLRHRLPAFARLTRKAVRALCRPFWAAGWSNLDIVHAMDHLPAAFGARAGTLIGRGPGEHLDPVQAWWWIRTRLDAWRDADGQVRRGYYQTRGRRRAMRAAVAARYGRAGLAVLPDVDLAADPVLTAEKVAEFGRRIAAQMRPAMTAAANAAGCGQVGVTGERTRAAAAAVELVSAAVTQRRARQLAAAEHGAALMARLAPQLQAARAELAERNASAPAAPISLREPAELTPAQRYERARALAAGYRRDRQRRHRPQH
jgi:hypothetical protein